MKVVLYPVMLILNAIVWLYAFVMTALYFGFVSRDMSQFSAHPDQLVLLIVVIAAPASALVYGFRKPWKTVYPVMMILNAILLVWLFVMLVQYLGFVPGAPSEFPSDPDRLVLLGIGIAAPASALVYGIWGRRSPLPEAVEAEGSLQ
jgi:hypothetical protein